MKSIYILAAIILVFSDSVLTADDDTEVVQRNAETSLGLKAIDIILDPVVPFDADMTFKLMDKLCGQVVDAMRGIVSGALNVDTGEFKTWAEYTATEGQNPNQAFYFATGPWQTFIGECMLKPQSTWWERSHTSFGSWGENRSNRRGRRQSQYRRKFRGIHDQNINAFVACKMRGPKCRRNGDSISNHARHTRRPNISLGRSAKKI